MHHCTKRKLNKNVLAAAFSLACLEIGSRNEEAINSTWNRIYSLKVLNFLLYRRRVFFRISTFYCFWIDLVRVLATTEIRLRLQAIRVYKYNGASVPGKLHHCQRSKTWFTWHVSSIIAKNKKHAHHKIICKQWKFTTPDHRSFAKKDSYFYSTTQ